MWLYFLVHFCKMMISPGVFFPFSKILILWGVRGAKEQKMVQNDKKLCLLCTPAIFFSVSQEPFMWL